MIEDLGQFVGSDAAAALRDLPFVAHALVAGGALVGLTLWLLGGRALKAAFAGLASATGALLGLTVGVGGAIETEPWIMGLTGFAAGLLFGLILFRMTVALVLAAVLAVTAPLAASTLIREFGSPVGHLIPDDGPLGPSELFLDGVPTETGGFVDSEIARRATETAEDAADRAGAALDRWYEDAAGPEDPDADEPRTPPSERVRRFLSVLWDELTPLWEGLAPMDRALLLLSSVTGWAVGLSLGLVMPRRAAGLVAAGAGAAVWMSCAVVLATAAYGGAIPALPRDPLIWLGIWAGVTVLGAGLQWTFAARRADKAQS